MSRALLELIVLQLRGRLVRLRRLLRQPRYLIGYLVGVGYLIFVYGGRLSGWRSGGSAATALPTMMGRFPFLPAMVALGLAIATTLIWMFAPARPALRLTEAEINFLLPAPLTRRQVLIYALWKQQAGVLVGALVVNFVRGAAWQGHRFERFFATWALLTLIDLHIKGVSLWKTRLKMLPPMVARLWVALAAAAFLTFWCLLIAWLWPPLAQLARSGALHDFEDVRAALEHVFAGPVGTLLTPFTWISRPLVGGALGWAGVVYLLALLVVHQEWVLRSRGQFEEASLARAERRARGRGRERRDPGRASQRQRRRAPFVLRPTGRPEIAIFWKNLLQHNRRPLAQRAAGLGALFALLTIAVAFLGSQTPIVETLKGISLAGLFAVPPMCGLFLRNDLRSELTQLETVRSWPITGRRFVLAELFAPATTALALLAAAYGLLLAATAGEALSGSPVRQPPQTLLGEGGLVILGAAVAMLSIALQNLAALMFPSWILSARRRQPGSVLTGQRLLLFAAHILCLAVALLPAAIVVGLVVLGQKLADVDLTLSEAPLVALLAIVPILVEVALVVGMAGRRWDALDPSQELLDREE